jgi:fibronectin-binding autotransporter adhesin
MDQQRANRRCAGHATRLIERRERLAPAEFSFVRSQAPRTRLLFVCALSICLALLMAWAGVGLPRFLESRAVYAAGTTRYVSNVGGDSSNDCATNANPCKTIQHAVDQSAAGDAILVAGGVYTGLTQHLGLPFLVFISITLSIQGGYTTTDSFAISDPVANPTILDAERGGYNIFFYGANGDFSNLTIQNGNVPTGFGGGIFALQGNVLTLTHVTVISNTAESGGGISADGRVVMRDVTVMSNTATNGGGGALVEAGSVPGVLMLDGGVFQNNSVNAFQSAGAGLEVQGTLTLSGTQFLSNTVLHGATGGGGVYASGAVTITSGRFRNNDGGGGLGGGLYAVGPLVMSDTQFAGNVARRGGGAAVQNAATLDGGLFQNNIGSEDIGGGLYAFGATVLTGTQFLSNTAAEKGGGLYAQDTLVLTGTRFLGNTASQGGGVYHAGGTGRAVNTLFARNVAGSGLGAALYLNSPGSVQILFTTIASPTVAGGSAIQVAGGIVGITDTIIASHTIGISQAGGTVYEDYNLLFANTSPLSGTVASDGHSLSGDPGFGAPFADNYHLQPGSAAIDNGINAGITSDLDGNPRPRGPAFDIGAYEAPFMPPVVFIPLISN